MKTDLLKQVVVTLDPADCTKLTLLLELAIKEDENPNVSEKVRDFAENLIFQIETLM